MPIVHLYTCTSYTYYRPSESGIGPLYRRDHHWRWWVSYGWMHHVRGYLPLWPWRTTDTTEWSQCDSPLDAP